MHGIDASKIAPGLFQGSKPPFGDALSRARFDVLVLAAREHQPGAGLFPRVRVVRAPLDDVNEPLTAQEVLMVRRVADEVAAAVDAGQKVIITCAAGLNRSGLITAAALKRLTGGPMTAVVSWIRAARGPWALSNQSFVRELTSGQLDPQPVVRLAY